MTVVADYQAKSSKPAAVARVVGSPDSHGRSLAKAVTWRAIGTADTFLWALLVTHQPVAAGTVASIETFTKIFLFYVHERVWRLFKWAPSARIRSLIKSISWRVCGSLDTALLTFLVTGRIKYAVQVAGAEAFTKIALYYVHERVWRRVSWGRLDAPAQAAPAEAAKAEVAAG